MGYAKSRGMESMARRLSLVSNEARMIVSVNCGPSCPSPPTPMSRTLMRPSGVLMFVAPRPKQLPWRTDGFSDHGHCTTSENTLVPRLAARYDAAAPTVAKIPTQNAKKTAMMAVFRPAVRSPDASSKSTFKSGFPCRGGYQRTDKSPPKPPLSVRHLL